MDSILNVIMQGNEVYCFNYALTSLHNNIVYRRAFLYKVCPSVCHLQNVKNTVFMRIFTFQFLHTSHIRAQNNYCFPSNILLDHLTHPPHFPRLKFIKFLFPVEPYSNSYNNPMGLYLVFLNLKKESNHIFINFFYQYEKKRQL